MVQAGERGAAMCQRRQGSPSASLESGSCWFPVSGVNAHRARAEIDDLQQAADDHDVLEEMDHLVLIGEIAMEENGSCQRKQGNNERDEAGAVADYKRGLDRCYCNSPIRP
jgi:hypothetical protein